MTHPYNEAIRSKLDLMPERIRFLHVSDRGYPIPWFVYVDPNGKVDFRVSKPRALLEAVRHNKCWVCGGPLGRTHATVIGPMCAITRTNSEPPSHTDCAIYSAKVCPFLSNPRMRRNERDLPENHFTPGMGIDRNPGVVAVWVSRSFSLFNDGRNNALVRIGDPIQVRWYAGGRDATRAEVMESIDSGFPILQAEARKQPGAMQALLRQRDAVVPYLPL